jgi:YVTN family beta-propeller protein
VQINIEHCEILYKIEKENNLFLLLIILIPIIFVILGTVTSYFVFPFTIYPALAQIESDNRTYSNEKGFLYVGNAKSNNISVVDLATNKAIKNITVGSGTHDIKISDDQQTVYTTDIDSGTVSIVNATSNTLMD